MPDLQHRVEMARRLNRGGVSAAPLERLPIVSIFDDDEYENYDVDLISPRRRLRIASVLADAGYRQTSGRVLEPPDGTAPVVFPRPARLGSDPSRPAADLLASGDVVVLVTPTQALLLYLHHFGDEPADALAGELQALVREQPANLAKVHEWARHAGHGGLFGQLRPGLDEAQAEGIELRKQRAFRSRLPR